MKWCPHITWLAVSNSTAKGIKTLYRWWTIKTGIVPKDWQCCPICGAQRPVVKEEKKQQKLKL